MIKDQRINLWENMKRPQPPKKRNGTLSEQVSDMVAFFNGFEGDDTVIIMPFGDYANHKDEFKRNGTLQLNGMEVHLDGFLPNGHILITNKEESERILKTGT